MPYVEGEGQVKSGDVFIFEQVDSGFDSVVGGGRSLVVQVVPVEEVDKVGLEKGQSILYGSNLLDDPRLVNRVEEDKAYIVSTEENKNI